MWYQLNYGRAAMSCRAFGEALNAFRMIEKSDKVASDSYRDEAIKSIEQIRRIAISSAQKLVANAHFAQASTYLDLALQAGASESEVDELRANLHRRMYSEVSAIFRDTPDQAREALNPC